MATIQKLKPCPRCGGDNLAIYTYENGGRHVECDDCLYLGPCCTSLVWAARHHNNEYEARKAAYAAAADREHAGAEVQA